MKIIWNGGFELDWKILCTAVWAVWMTAGGWYKLDNLERAVLAHNAWAATKADELTVAGERLNALEIRIDPCCPLYKAQSKHRQIRRNR